MTGAVLAIDQGTSGTKAIVADPEGRVLAAVEVPIRPRYLPGAGVEQDPQELLQSVLDAGRQALAAAGAQVQAVSLANQGESVLAWDPKTGRALSPVVVWQDGRAESLCQDLAGWEPWVRARTGLKLDPYFSAPKMAWLRRTLTTEGLVTTTDSWLIHHLTGEFVTDVATASRSMLMNLDDASWDPELLGLFALDTEPMPRIVDCDQIIGATTAFGPDIPLAGLIVDQQAALLAQGCWDPGAAKCTLGTGAFLLANTGSRAPRSNAGLTTSVAWRIRSVLDHCIDGQVFTVASAVRWLIDLGLLRSAADIDQVAATDSEGVLCVPALAGLGAPWWRADATATLTGLTLSSTAGHLVLAVLEGIAAQIAVLCQAVGSDLGAPMDSLQVDGGLTRSSVLMQAVADLAQIPVRVFPSAHATAQGAAALGQLALQPGSDLADVITRPAATVTYEPRQAAGWAADFLSRWRSTASTHLDPKEAP